VFDSFLYELLYFSTRRSCRWAAADPPGAQSSATHAAGKAA
jgi:hypothetical protein